MPAGRPSKYKPEYCELLEGHFASGLSYEAFAGVLKVSIETLYNWEKDFPEFLEAKKTFWEIGREKFENIGLQGMMGKIPGFNTTVWIFTMKNRFGWRDSAEIRHTQIEPVNIMIKTLEGTVKQIAGNNTLTETKPIH